MTPDELRKKREYLELQEELQSLELQILRIDVARAKIAEDLARLDTNETATRAAIAERQAKLPKLIGKEG